MLTVTDEAKTHLKTLIDQSGLDDNVALRLVANEQGLGLQPDTAKDTDTAYTEPGSENTVLVVDETLAGKLGAVTLGVEQTAEGARLAITQ